MGITPGGDNSCKLEGGDKMGPRRALLRLEAPSRGRGAEDVVMEGRLGE